MDISEENRAVILAKLDGKVIQHRWTTGGPNDREWSDMEPCGWSFVFGCNQEYRIKPEPRRWWIQSDGRPVVFAHASYGSAKASQIGGSIVEVVEVIDGS